MERKQIKAIAAGAALLTLMAARPATGLLTDMASHWAGSLVGALEARGIVSGDEDLRFHPDTPLTRAQLAKLLVTGLGYSDDASLLGRYGSRFADVPTWHWANGYIESLAETGAVEGYPDGSFGPADEVTRAQLAAIFVRAAGLAEQARLMRFEHTTYADDKEIPEWARGFVHVAQTTGMMAGFEDNSFRPLLPVTRAEGSTALFRLLALKGRVFHLSGTLVRFDPATRAGTVRDGLGRETDFTMSPSAQYYRAGLPSYTGQIQPLDQVWIVLGPDGAGTFLDARYEERMATSIRVVGERTITATLPGGGTRTSDVPPGALVYLNGRPSTLDQLNRVTQAYLVLDRITGDIRVLDAISVSLSGSFNFYAPTPPSLILEVNQEIQVLRLSADALYVLNGQPVQPTELRVDDRLQVVQNEAGDVTYVLAER
ncbi:MAG TPA: S-layer homology domain-containing protein [Symbiobacteriaceae bacterium]|nr:S-layer homology domain-containing protein [Symbiobacteriaceae bacterium]